MRKIWLPLAIVFTVLSSFSPAFANGGLIPAPPSPDDTSRGIYAGVWGGASTQSKGENSFALSPEAVARLAESHGNIPWELGLYGRISFSSVAGSFWTGSQTVKFEQDRFRFGFGPEFAITTSDGQQTVKARALYQVEYDLAMKRSDWVKTHAHWINVPELDLIFSDSQFLPVPFHFADIEDYHAYKALELLGNVNVDDGVPWYRATFKYEVFVLGAMRNQDFGDLLFRREGSSWEVPTLSLRLGPRVEGYNASGNWHSQAGGYVEAYSPAIPISFDFSALYGNVGGLQLQWGMWVAVRF